jgi:hypothetical protein
MAGRPMLHPMPCLWLVGLLGQWSRLDHTRTPLHALTRRLACQYHRRVGPGYQMSLSPELHKTTTERSQIRRSRAPISQQPMSRRSYMSYGSRHIYQGR